MNNVIPLTSLVQKRTEGVQIYSFSLTRDGKKIPLDSSHKFQVSFSYKGSLVKTVDLAIVDGLVQFTSEQITELPSGMYRLEFWELVDDKVHAIYPADHTLSFVINDNSRDLPTGKVTSLTLDEFVKEFKRLVKVGGGSAGGIDADVSIDIDTRTITINGKSLTIPEPVDLSKLASKDDLVGLVKQTELAEYAKKDELPTSPDLTDYVKKEELPKQPDLTGYALKSDLPDLTGYAKMTDIPSVTGLVKEAELADYAKKSDLPDLSSYALKTDIPELPDTSNFVDKTELTNYATNESVDEKLKDKSLPGIIKTDYGTFLQHEPTSVRIINKTHAKDADAFMLFDNGAELHVKDSDAVGSPTGGWNTNFDHIDQSPNNLRNKIVMYMAGNFPLSQGVVYDRMLSATASSSWMNFAGCTVNHPFNDNSSKYIWDAARFTGDESKVTPGERDAIKAFYEVGLFNDYEVVTFCHVVKKEG